ncbi:MAG: apolipoprotein N-acyltransferase [Nitrospiraceae bacterium]|nr:apolipoprotein N-acyltransferase [Nitrospiraceae bacterium]
MRTIKEIFNNYASAAISGTALIFCFPLFNLSYLAWIALVPFLVSLLNKNSSEAFRSGFVLGIFYFFGTLYWISHSINHYGGISLIPSLGIVLLLCLYLSLYPALFAVFFSWKISTTRYPALLLGPVFWVSLEYLRTYAITGFPWSIIGYSQYRFLEVIQIADITGVYGISFLILAVNGAIADIFIVKKRLRQMPLFSLSQTTAGVFILSFCVFFVFFYGYFRLAENRTDKSVRVSIVQGNIEQDRKWDAAYQRNVLDTYKNMSLTAAAESPNIIVWPESSIPFYFNYDVTLTQELIDFQKTLNAYLLFGSVLMKEQSSVSFKPALSNSAVLLAPDGKPSFIYDKIHLVPFGEYVPLRNFLFFVDKLVVSIGDFVPGDHTLRAETAYGSFGISICYEMVFPGLIRKFFAKGGDFMVAITNDAWFGSTAGPHQHFSMAVFRAVENRKPVIRAANAGISGFIDSNGQILATSQLFKPAVMTMNIATDKTNSFYSRFGDLFSYIFIVIAILLITNSSKRR